MWAFPQPGMHGHPGMGHPAMQGYQGGPGYPWMGGGMNGMPAHMQMMAPQSVKGAGGKADGTRKKKKKRVLEGGPKKPATSFVLFSNTVREQVKADNPGLPFIELGRKLGEMWRDMEPELRKEYEDKANAAKEIYMAEKKEWMANRAATAQVAAPVAAPGMAETYTLPALAK